MGHALYAPTRDGCAQVAFAIAANYQAQGLATILLVQLADAAAGNGIETFEALVLRENRRMLEVLRESGFPIKTRYEWDIVVATFPTSRTPQALARFAHFARTTGHSKPVVAVKSGRSIVGARATTSHTGPCCPRPT